MLRDRHPPTDLFALAPQLGLRFVADGRDAPKAAYGRRIGIAKRTAGQAERVRTALEASAAPAARRLAVEVGVEFGRKVRLDEAEGGIVTAYRVLDQGGGQDYGELAGGPATHRRLFGRAPRLRAADRGFPAPRDEKPAKESG